MAKIETFLERIADKSLRAELAEAIREIKEATKFGLVFEEHLPELLEIPDLPIRKGTLVSRKESGADLWTVLAVNGSKARCRRDGESGPHEEIFAVESLIAVKRFGDPIYPALVPIDRVQKSDSRPFHLLIQADNFHALQLLTYTHERKIDVIYIDPPYNNGEKTWKYNNNFVDRNDRWLHSKWLSFMKRRLLLAKQLLAPNGVVIVAIDDYEVFHLGCLLEDIFRGYTIETAVVNHHPQGAGGDNLSRTHEYAIFCVPPGVTLRGAPVKLESDEWSLQRAGTDKRNFRKGRPNQFFAILVDPKTRAIKGLGPTLGKEDKYPTGKTKEGYTRIYPLDRQKRERVWRYNRKTMLEKIAKKNIIYTKKGSFKVAVDRKGKTNPIFTNWTDGRYNAGTHGTNLLEQFLGESGRFPYPKSLYTVHDCIAAAVRGRDKAIICDFFGGSGTTLHATEYYNAVNNTAHQCILITNNELDYDTEVRLRKKGFAAGDKEWESEGICKSVTWPRLKAATSGKRNDKSQVPGSYIDGRAYKEGFAENVQYSELKFLDQTHVALGEEFQAILPILWIMAGAAGALELSKGSTAWFIPKSSPFAVLIRESKFAEFRDTLDGRDDISHVFLVTNSEESFREMTQLLPRRLKTRMLYKSYLDNFRLNTGKAA